MDSIAVPMRRKDVRNAALGPRRPRVRLAVATVRKQDDQHTGFRQPLVRQR
jgi:hypothetical protein